jgi:hypothetical protein
MNDDASRPWKPDDLQEKLLAVLADADAASVQLPGGSTLTIDRNSPDGATVRIDVDGAVFRGFPPAKAAPEGYPADLPFVSGRAVLLSQVPDDLVALQWLGAEAAAGVAGEMERLLLRDGWERTEVQTMPELPVTAATFAKGDMERTLASGASMVMLLQKRKRA